MLLITPSEVVEYAFIPREKISPLSIRPLKIEIASDHFVRPRFGDKLYEKFILGEHQPFVDEFLKPAIAHFVRYAIIDELSIQMSDTGAILFENERQQSQQEQSTRSTANDDSTSNGSNTGQSQLTIDNMKAHDSSTLNTTLTTTDGKQTATGNSNTTGQKSVSDVDKRKEAGTTDLTKTAMSDTTQSSNDKTNTETLDKDDYSYHEATVTIGVSREGYTHKTIDDEAVKISTTTDSSTASDTALTTISNTTDITHTSTESSSSTTDNDSIGTSLSKADAKSTGSITGTETTEQQNKASNSLTTTNQTTAISERLVSGDGQTTTQRDGCRMATDKQRQIIRARALADANILISRAVRYIERNIELFAEYQPQPRSQGGIVL